MTPSRIASAGLYALLLIGSSAICAAEDKPQDADKHMNDAQMKKHCEEMMKDPNMSSKMPAADHQAMMKRCQELKQQEEMKRKPPR